MTSIDMCDQLSCFTSDFTANTSPQKRIYQHFTGQLHARPPALQLHTHRVRPAPGVQRLTLQTINVIFRQHQQLNLNALLPGQTSHNQAVATIIPGTTDDGQTAHSRPAPQQLGKSGMTCSLHQPKTGDSELLYCGSIQGATLGGRV